MKPEKQAPNSSPFVNYLARRSAAYAVDVALLAVGVSLSQSALRLFGLGLPTTARGWQIEAWVLATVSLPAWLYFIVLERGRGTTIGKRLLGLRVESADGGPLSLVQAIVRTGLKLLPWELTHLTLLLPQPIWSDPQPDFRPALSISYALLGLYLICAALTPRRQTLPDVAAGTVVYRP